MGMEREGEKNGKEGLLRVREYRAGGHTPENLIEILVTRVVRISSCHTVKECPKRSGGGRHRGDGHGSPQRLITHREVFPSIQSGLTTGTRGKPEGYLVITAATPTWKRKREKGGEVEGAENKEKNKV